MKQIRPEIPARNPRLFGGIFFASDCLARRFILQLIPPERRANSEI
jgi:hypothetical protein